MLLLAAIALVWMIVALAAVALCMYARDSDQEIAEAQAAPAVTVSSAA